MVATSMEQLETMLMNEISKAMNIVSAKVLADMHEETGGFYSQGSPTIYNRTGALGNTPRTTAITKGGKEVSFDAYLDQGYSYSMPNYDFIEKGWPSYFSTSEVLDAAEVGAANIKGKPGFWARSEQKMQQELDSVMASFFH